MARLELKNIYKKYPRSGNYAVEDISLVAPDGEFVVLVGPSGCGKSTILRMVAGLEDITKGEIWFDEKAVNERSPRDRDVGMVFQNYALYPHLNVFNNIAFPLKIKKVRKKEIKARVSHVAKMLDLHDYLDRKPKELSGGQRQRVALGRAIVRNPEIFLFDEPLSNLDAKLRVQMRTEISKLQNDLGITSVYVTHDQVEAMTMASKLAVLKDGRLQQFDEPEVIYNRPANTFVAGFIGSPQMNFFTGYFGDKKFIEKNDGIEIKFADDKIFMDFQDEEVILGLRPENIDLAHANNEVNFHAEIINIENVGHERLAYFESNENLHSIRLSGDADIKKGKADLKILKENKILIFDRKGKLIDNKS